MGKQDFLWKGITEQAFIEETPDEMDISEYNKERMVIYSANINYLRQMVKDTDGLKPVLRRMLMTFYKLGQGNVKKTGRLKSSNVVSETMKSHPHGDAPIYEVLVAEGQYWKKNVPIINGHGNFGDPTNPEGYAHMRYTTVELSKYGQDCFFSDFDPECLDIMPGSLLGDELLSLPAKYPHIFINGGMGIANGFKYLIPPFNVGDVYNLFEKLILDPDSSDIYLIPEIPTGCDIVEDDRTIREFCETGSGKLRMRSRIDIEEDKKGNWVLVIKNFPWLVNWENVKNSIREMIKSNKVPIIDIRDSSQAFRDGDMTKKDIRIELIIPRTHDPVKIRSFLFKNTSLDITLSVKFIITTNDLFMGIKNVKDLALDWLDHRREYIRRLYNKRIQKGLQRMEYLSILIEVLKNKSNTDKAISIIYNSSSDTAVSELVREYPGMNSFHASKIVHLPLGQLNQTTRKNAEQELEKLKTEVKELKQINKSDKRINKVILSQLGEMLKYDSPKKCRLITTDNETEISDTNHVLIFTKKGLIKKLPNDDRRKNASNKYGNFENDDSPVTITYANNLDSLLLVDTYGKYSIVPVHNIPATNYDNTGNKIYDYTKLSGEIIYASSCITDDIEREFEKLNILPFFTILTKSGFIKKINLSELKSSSTKGVKIARLKENDKIVFADIVFDTSSIIVYTKNGNFSYFKESEIPLYNKEAIGASCMELDDEDSCVGCTIISPNDKYLLITTKRGYMKKLNLDDITLGRRRRKSYLSSIPKNDELLVCSAVSSNNSQVKVFTKNSIIELDIKDIPSLSRKVLPVKLISLSSADNIIRVMIL